VLVRLNNISLHLFQQRPGNSQTFTLYNINENSTFSELEDKLMLRMYFARPHACWKRGTNENTNGLRRRFSSEGTIF